MINRIIRLSTILWLFVSFTLSADEIKPSIKMQMWAYVDDVTGLDILSHKQNNLRILFTPTGNLSPDSMAYRVTLSGGGKIQENQLYKTGWMFYTDLKPGVYNLRAEGTYHGGRPGPPIEHRFTIDAPWWLKWPALTAYGVAALALVCYIWHVTRSRIRLHTQLVAERQNHRFKTDFVLQASRDFRTPLTIIRTTIEKIKSGNDMHMTRTDLKELRSSCDMLMNMVENLVTFGEPAGNAASNTGDVADSAEMPHMPLNDGLTVMVAENDPRLAQMMVRHMSKYMNVEIVDEDKMMWYALKRDPDAIVIDTALKNINAYDLVGKLKKNKSTKSIPTILISDFDNSRSVLRAIRSGAEDYLKKPFNCDVLTAIILKKVKETRETEKAETEHKAKTQEEQCVTSNKLPDTGQSIAQPTDEQHADSAIKPTTGTNDENMRGLIEPVFETEADKLLFERIDMMIDERMSNERFEVTRLAADLDVSRDFIYRKIKSVYQTTPLEYLRERRLIKAAALIRDSYITVKEARHAVGMPDPVNFNRRFRERFGMTPTQWIMTKK